MHGVWRQVFVGGLLVALSGVAPDDAIDQDIAAINRAGKLGAGSSAARQACNDLARRGPEVLPRLLTAMDTANLVAANWYRAAYERIVAREFARSTSRVPRQEFEAFVRDPRHAGRPRRLALALLDRQEPTFGKALVPTLVEDPEFRDDAIAAVLQHGDDDQAHGRKDAAKSAYRTAFDHARTAKQVADSAAKLESLGDHVDIPHHLGFVTDWQIIGPFDAPGMSGFAKVFPPETALHSLAPVVSGTAIPRWSPHRTSDPLGTIDLVRALGPAKEAVAYAYVELDSAAERDAQVRCSADDCLAVWLNGQNVFGREMWLNGTRLDRFIAPVHLKAGRNRVLVKICQGPQHRDASVGNAWTFQLRFCSPDGAGLPLKTVPFPEANASQ